MQERKKKPTRLDIEHVPDGMLVDKANDSVLDNLSAETSKAKSTKRRKMEKSKQNTQELWPICRDINL